jgi:hypothetical protein
MYQAILSFMLRFVLTPEMLGWVATCSMPYIHITLCRNPRTGGMLASVPKPNKI